MKERTSSFVGGALTALAACGWMEANGRKGTRALRSQSEPDGLRRWLLGSRPCSGAAAFEASQTSVWFISGETWVLGMEVVWLRAQ